MAKPHPSDLLHDAVVDVVVVGLGPTGLAVTALLARAGVGVCALECRVTPFTHPRAAAIDDEALRCLLEVDARLDEPGHGVRGDVVVTMDAQLVDSRGAFPVLAPASGFPLFIAPCT